MGSRCLFFLSLTLILLPLSGRAHGLHRQIVVAGSPSPATTAATLPKSLEAVYQYDDGTTEDFLIPSLNGGDDQPEAIFLEQFTVIPGQNVIDSIAIAWGSEVGTRPERLNGRPVTLGIWSDPDNDGQPYDAVLIGWVEGVVASANTDTFITYTFNHPVTIPDDNSFFLGFKTPVVRRAQAEGKHYAFAGLDRTSAALNAWVVWNDPNPKVGLRRLGENSVIYLESDVYFAGSFMIRSGF